MSEYQYEPQVKLSPTKNCHYWDLYLDQVLAQATWLEFLEMQFLNTSISTDGFNFVYNAEAIIWVNIKI